jgi:hypothetical protein
MHWKEKERYRGFLVWVGKLRDGRWVASVAALPEQGSGFTARPGEHCAPGDFPSEEQAELAARNYIDQIQAGRGR